MKYRSYFSGRALDKELRNLFEEKGKLPDLSHVEHRRQRRTVHLLLGLVVFFALLTGVSWAGFFLFGPRGGGGEVKLEFQGPEVVVAGVPLDLKLRYKNSDRAPLALANLALRLPDQLFIVSADPAPGKDPRRFELGTIPERSSGEIALRVIPYGNQEEPVELTGVFSYKPANFNAEFQTSAAHRFTIRAIPLELNLTGPSQSSPGEPAKFSLKIRNTTDEPLADLQATFYYPSTFLLALASGNNGPVSRELGELAPGQETELALEGAFLNSAKGAQKFNVQLEVRREGKLFPVGQIQQTTELASPIWQIDTLINETPDLNWLRLNQPLRLRITTKNQSQDTLADRKLRLTIAGEVLAWDQAQIEDGRLDQAAQIITFPASGTLAFAPNEVKEFKATLPLQNRPNRTVAPSLIINVELLQGSAAVKMPPKKLTLVSDLAVSGEARYFGADGKPTGAGPLPPKVGEETQYEIRFRLKNTFHDLDRLVVSAKLPETSRFIQSRAVQAGRLQYNESSREIRWEIPRMTVTTPELTAAFTLGATAVSQDQGQLLTLIGVIRAEALDAITQTDFSADAPPVSSSLDADPFGRGKGVVQ